jgi:2-hydroxy-3-keto-5-methylthiopentenyl-1-phosphate phosphatase
MTNALVEKKNRAEESQKLSMNIIDKLTDFNTALIVASYAADTEINRDYIASMLGNLSSQLERITEDIQEIIRN